MLTRAWLAINRSPRGTFLAIAFFYLGIACGQAATKLLWCDELITLGIAQQHSLAGIWHALALGADPNPPLMHWMVMASTSAFGDGALAVRLPAVLCGLLAVVSLWAILRRWLLPGYATVGILAFMATRGFDYVYDARSYAPLMGLAMASFACWLLSTNSDSRRWVRLAALGGMTAALALGVSSNYYGVLAFFPIAAGEFVRTRAQRRLAPGAWIAMLVGALPLIAYLPLIHHNIAEFSPHAWNRPRAGMILDSYTVLVEGVFWPVLALGVWWMFARKRSRAAGSETGGNFLTLNSFEVTAVVTLLLYPFLGFSIAAAGAGMISPRCVVPVCCGFGIAAGLLAGRVFGDSARSGVLCLAAMLLWVVARESACAVVLQQQRRAFLLLRDQVAALPASGPILVGDSLIVLPLAHYSSESVRSRILFPIDFEAIHRSEPDDSGEQNLWAGRNGVFPVTIRAYDRAFFPYNQFAVVGNPGGWLAQRLAADGIALTEDQPESGSPAWGDLGGIFTPLAHEQTRILLARHTTPGP